MRSWSDAGLLSGAAGGLLVVLLLSGELLAQGS